MEFNTLVEVIESAGYETYSYSGRGMYGNSCVGFTVDREYSIFQAISQILEDMDIDMESGNLYDFTAILRSAQMDSMGLDTVIYFPRVKWVDED